MIRDVPWHVLAGRDVLAAWMRELHEHAGRIDPSDQPFGVQGMNQIGVPAGQRIPVWAGSTCQIKTNPAVDVLPGEGDVALEPRLVLDRRSARLGDRRARASLAGPPVRAAVVALHLVRGGRGTPQEPVRNVSGNACPSTTGGPERHPHCVAGRDRATTPVPSRTVELAGRAATA